jgi:Leucine-rich repeat (LRR) protein
VRIGTQSARGSRFVETMLTVIESAGNNPATIHADQSHPCSLWARDKILEVTDARTCSGGFIVGGEEESLNLQGTQVTNAGLKELAGLKSLQTLNLSNTKVTDVGLKDLAGLKSLHSLDLGRTQVTDKGLKELAGFKSLQTLNLGFTRVTDAGVAELQKALPACSIGRGPEPRFPRVVP